jgi:hypothetical protein
MTMQHTQPATTRLTADVTSTRLHDLLEQFILRYDELEAVVTLHREAIRRADTAAMQAAIEQHARIMRELGGLEVRRCELVAMAVSSFPVLAAKRQSPVTLTDLVGVCTDRDRLELQGLAKELKTRVMRTRELTQSLRSATTTLLAHMEGLMRQVGRHLSHAGTYSKRGVVEPALVVSAVDLRS